eukprot:gene11349-4517_t
MHFYLSGWNKYCIKKYCLIIVRLYVDIKIESQYFTDILRSNGHYIPWTPLQYATALGNQDVVLFLIRNGADINIKDKSERNAQEIANLLGRVQINIETLKNEVDGVYQKFKNFVSNPIGFFKEENNTYQNRKLMFTKFLHIYQQFVKNRVDNHDLQKILKKRIETSKNPVVIKMFKNQKRNFKQKFIQKVSEAKKKMTLPKKMRIEMFSKIEFQVDKFPTFDEDQLCLLVCEDWFVEWSENKSNFTKEFDTLMGFNKSSQKEMTEYILKGITSKTNVGVELSEFFPELEEFFGIMKQYFLGEEIDSMVSFYELHKKII